MGDLRYPVGRFSPPTVMDAATRESWLGDLEELPAKLVDAVRELSEQQFGTPYRPGGWTVRQVVHHLADSHLNSYCRFRLALTEENPTIRPYDEAEWAELKDAKSAPVELSLSLLKALHGRWVLLLRSLSDVEFGRTYRHPEMGEKRLDWTLGLYAWHSRHHVAQITALRKREGWSFEAEPLDHRASRKLL